MIRRGDVHWIDLGRAVGSEPAGRRPVLVVSADRYNRSRLRTVLAVVVTSNLTLAEQPGNVFLPAATAGLARDSVVNVTQVITVDRARLDPHPAGSLPEHVLRQVADGLRQALAL